MSVLPLFSWSPHRTVLWTEHTWTIPNLYWNPCHDPDDRQCHSEGGLLCKLHRHREDCTRRLVLTCFHAGWSLGTPFLFFYIVYFCMLCCLVNEELETDLLSDTIWWAKKLKSFIELVRFSGLILLQIPISSSGCFVWCEAVNSGLQWPLLLLTLQTDSHPVCLAGAQADCTLARDWTHDLWTQWGLLTATPFGGFPAKHKKKCDGSRCQHLCS